MSTIKTDKIIPVGSALTVEGAAVITAGVSANSTLSVGGSVYAAANVFATGGTVVMSSAYTHRNRIINGDMRVNQRGATGATYGSIAGGQTKVFDMWNINRTAGNTFSYVGGVTATATPSGQRQYLRVTTAATTKALVNTDYGSVYQSIEGSNVDDLLYGTDAARTTTLSFWVRCSVTGTFTGSPKSYPNGARSYAYPYTINAANTWEYKTVTIPGDTGGTWQTGTSGQIYIQWNMGSGFNYGSATTTTWNSNDQYFITGSTQLVSTANATWDITGVQWELGSVATPFEYRPYSVELAMCQRYLQVFTVDGHSFPGNWVSATQWTAVPTLQTVMRGIPSITITNITNGVVSFLSSNYAWQSFTSSASTTRTLSLFFTCATNGGTIVNNTAYGVCSPSTATQASFGPYPQIIASAEL